MTGRRSHSRRATVLFAVFFLVVLAGLSATTMLGAVEAERASASRTLEGLELQAAARSALLVYLSEIDAQRETLLDGGEPRFSPEITVGRGEGRAPVRIRLLPASDGSLVESESARLDLNRSTPGMLSSLPGLSADAVRGIVARREGIPIASPNAVADLLEPWEDRFSAGDFSAGEVLAGDVFSPGAVGAGVSPPGSAGTASPGDELSVGPLDLLTVFSADPQTQAGLGDESLAGLDRVCLNAPWSGETERAFQTRASPAVAATATALFIEAPAIESPSALAGVLIDKGVPVEEWGGLLDTCTTTADPFALGLVDINRAPRSVLAALPGLDAAIAGELIAARDRLDATARRSLAWPVAEGVLTPEQFAQAADFITTRSLQWRIRFGVSIDPRGSAEGAGDDPFGVDLLGDADEFGVALEPVGEGDGAAAAGIVYEAVLDAAGDRARIAYLRDRTSYEFVERLAGLGLVGTFEGAGDGPVPWRPARAPVSGTPEAGAAEGGAPMTLEELNASFFDEEPGGLAGEAVGDEPAGLIGDFPTSFFDDVPPPTDGGADGPEAAPEPAPGGGGRDNRVGRWKPSGGAAGGRGER